MTAIIDGTAGITFPAGGVGNPAGAVVGTTDTQTLTNKTLTGAVMNGTVGATTPATGAFTTLSASSTLSVTGAGSIEGLTVGRGAGAVSSNTAVGASALAANTSGTTNTAIGERSLFSTTTGAGNTAVGYRTLYTNVSGTENTAQGYAALYYNTGNANSAYGYQTLFNNTTASNNTAVGYQAGYTNQTGTANAFFGISAGYAATGSRNTLIGPYVGFSVTTGAGNTFIGNGGSNNSAGAGYYMTTGNDNTIIGGFTGNQGGLDIRTASNYIVLSDGLGNPRAHCTTVGAWYFHNSGGSGSDVVNVASGAVAGTSRSLYTGWHTATTPQGGTLSFNVTTNGNVTNTNNSYGAISDIKLKENIVDALPKLADLMQVKVRNYNMIGDTTKQIGVVAQELETVFPSMIDVTPDRDKEGNDLGTTTKSVKYSVFVPMLIKAMQEQQAIIELLKARLDAANL